MRDSQNSLAAYYQRSGQSFLKAARYLVCVKERQEREDFDAAAQQLLGIGLEKTLKGALLLVGKNETYLKKNLGHDLRKSFEELESHPETQDWQNNIEVYCRNYWKAALRKLRDQRATEIANSGSDPNDPVFNLPDNSEIGSSLMSFKSSIVYLNKKYNVADILRYPTSHIDTRPKYDRLHIDLDPTNETLAVGGLELSRWLKYLCVQSLNSANGK